MAFCLSACDRGKTKQNVAANDTPRPLSQHNAPMMQPMDEMMRQIRAIRLTGDFEYDFVSMLIEHNRGANGMARLELEKGEDETLKQMARRIISRNEIAENKLIQFLKVYKPIEVIGDPSTRHNVLQDAIANAVVRMKGLMMTADIDKDFAMMMIPHHETSNEIFKAQLEHGKTNVLKQLSDKTTAIQKIELDSLNVWAFENK